VALVDHSGTSPALYFVHADHLGAPQKATDSSKSLVWDAQFEPFGETYAVSGALTQLLMFPGQYHDGETGYADNWHRSYDPATGRYLQADPLGLEAGVNLYAYANGNPVRYTDPTGEFVPFIVACFANALCRSAAGAAGGAVVDLALQLIDTRGHFECINWTEVGISALVGGTLAGLGRPATPKFGRFSAAQLQKFERQFAEHGRSSLERSRRSIERQLAEHQQSLAQYQRLGGHTSSVEREIANFEHELQAIEDVLRRNP
jgi:RHS repeat-associated protein